MAEETESPKLLKFSLPVDSDGKATEFKLFSMASPHMLSFHLAWLSLFSCFFATFSIPPLLPLIRADLGLTPSDIGDAGIASFAGSIFSRLVMGPACDLFGARIASATLSLITAAIVLATSFITSARSFIAIRFLVGFCLANFVSNQFWVTSLFSDTVVGLANGVSAGWAVVGAGATQLVMPLIYTFITSLKVQSSMAWRLAFIVPAIFLAVTAILVLAFGQDLPSGNYKRQVNTNERSDDNFLGILFHGLRNYRGWILALTYGYCCGVELTTNNIIAEYYYDRFDVNLQAAGLIAASFGMANCVSRPAGGVLSDELAKRFGMRGRLWGLWVMQTAAGLLGVLLGRVNSLWSSILVLCCFSFFVEAASGLTFGVIPFVSKRSLGVVSGMAGCGGSVGAVVNQYLLFSGSELSMQTSISLMGLMMIICTLPVILIRFPEHGGMFCCPSVDVNSSDDDYRLLGEDADDRDLTKARPFP